MQQRWREDDQLGRLERCTVRSRGLEMTLAVSAKPLQDDGGVEDDLGHRASRSARIATVESSGGRQRVARRGGRVHGAPRGSRRALRSAPRPALQPPRGRHCERGRGPSRCGRYGTPDARPRVGQVAWSELDGLAVADEARAALDDEVQLLLLLALAELVVRHDQQLALMRLERVDAEGLDPRWPRTSCVFGARARTARGRPPTAGGCVARARPSASEYSSAEKPGISAHDGISRSRAILHSASLNGTEPSLRGRS